jgi:hypothetical protein
MKLKVASNDRGDTFARPHTPCPLVHPDPKRVPKPTSNPATASSGSPCANSIGPNPMTAAGSTRPIRKASRQPFAPISPLTAFSKMPLMPAIFPFKSNSAAAPAPMSIPPNSDFQRSGVMSNIAGYFSPREHDTFELRSRLIRRLCAAPIQYAERLEYFPYFFFAGDRRRRERSSLSRSAKPVSG